MAATIICVRFLEQSLGSYLGNYLYSPVTFNLLNKHVSQNYLHTLSPTFSIIIHGRFHLRAHICGRQVNNQTRHLETKTSSELQQ